MVWAAETNIKGPKGDKGDPGASGAATCFMSDTAPVGKPPGSLWWETDTGYLYAYYDDGTSMQWVMVSPGSGGISQADADLRYVNVAGDTMTGDLTVAKDTPSLTVDRTGTAAGLIVGKKAGGLRWRMVLGDTIAESGSNAGSNFRIQAYADDGASQLATSLVISRATGVIDFASKPTVAGQVWAAPFDAMAYNGMQINGGFTVSQEKGATPTSASGSYFCDGWVLNAPANGLVNALATASGPQLQALGLPAICQVGTMVAAPSLAAGDSYTINHRIEGYRTARLGWGFATNPQPITFGFWTAHARAGVYSFVVRNVAFTRTYAATYTQDAAGVWEYKTVTVPGCPDGVWNLDNTTGITINFSQGCGTTLTAPSANSWLAGNYVAAPGQINAVAATSDIFRITGVVILPGSEAPDAARAPLIMRPYDQELLTCQRYYQFLKAQGGFVVETTPTMFVGNVSYSPMRSTPTLSIIGGSLTNGAHVPTAGFYDITGVNTFAGGTGSAYLVFNITSSVTGKPGGIYGAVSPGKLPLDARL